MSAPSDPRLKRFFDEFPSLNPFFVNRVDAPNAPNSDVREIHSAQFRKLTTLARQAGSLNRGIGVILWGEAGVGKSHLLSRLWSWTQTKQPAAFVYLHNLQVDAEHLPRYLLQCVVSTLTRNRVAGLYDSDLYRLIRDAIKEALRKAGITEGTQKQINAAYHRLIDDLIACNIAQPHLLDRTVFEVLWRFYLSARFAHERGKPEEVAVAAVHWLSGKEIDEAEARALGLRPHRPEEPIALAGNEKIKQVLAVLAQLALYRGMSFILCIDGVDNMGGERVAALWQFLHGLLDVTGNVLVISSGVHETMLKFLTTRVVQTSSWDRLGQHELALSRINGDSARRVLQERLDKSLDPFLDVKEVADARRSDPLFPLGTRWFNKRIGEGLEFRPRDWISWAEQRWTSQQERIEQLSPPAWLSQWDSEGDVKPSPQARLEELVDAKVAEKIADQLAQRRVAPHTLPPSADNLAGLVRGLLGQCLPSGAAVEPPTNPKARSPYQVVLRLPTGHIGLTFVTTASAVSATGHLRRLTDDSSGPNRVLLVTDERQPLPLGKLKNAAGRQLLKQLEKRGEAHFEHVKLPFSDYAHLDALQGVIGMAVSDDLAVEFPPGQRKLITDVEVIQSHHRCDRYADQALLAKVLNASFSEHTGERTAPDTLARPVNEADAPASNPTCSASQPESKAISADEMLIGSLVADNQPVGFPAADLLTHVSVVGAAGSGKTWLAKVLAEEAIAQGVPVLAIDPQGDLVQMCRPRPLEEIPTDERARYRRYWDRVEPRILTPGSSHGSRVSLSPIRLPSDESLAAIADTHRRAEAMEEMLGIVAANLVRLAKAQGEIESQQTFVLQVLRKLTALGGNESVSLSDLAASIMYPETIRLENAEEFVKKTERLSLARKLNALLHGPAAHLFSGGMSLDIDTMRRPLGSGKVPLNVIYLNALANDEQKQFFTAALAAEIYRWMMTSSQGAGAALLFYLDEARDFVPAGARKPPAKEALLRLFAQGRKYGVGCLICTQSPRSVDYNVFSNCSTKIIGRLEAAQDVERVADWFTQSGPAPAWVRGRQGAEPGTFMARWPGMSGALDGQSIRSRTLFSHHGGAWPPERVEAEWAATRCEENV
jgi:hypothetical protein